QDRVLRERNQQENGVHPAYFNVCNKYIVGISNFTSEHIPDDLSYFMTIVDTIGVEVPIIKGIFFPVELEEMDSTNIKEDPKLSTEFYKHLTNIMTRWVEKHAVNVLYVMINVVVH
ncbi:3040_t:CDS:2, partial [Funneliformis mosseae]